MAKAEIVGSWFPTGYHGHVRSKPRSDFVCEFRQLARPQPPRKFIVRSQAKPTVHAFSLHDNKQSFRSDALYFEQGLGRRRDPKRAYSFNREFISWLPPGHIFQNYPEYPLASTYRVNFQYKGPGQKVPQIMVKRPVTSFDRTDTTSYRYAHGSDNPHKDVINAMNNTALLLTYDQRKHHTPRTKLSGRDTVASCMTWHVPEPPKRTRVPAATQTTDYMEVQENCKASESQGNVTLPEPKSIPIAWPHPPCTGSGEAE